MRHLKILLFLLFLSGCRTLPQAQKSIPATAQPEVYRILLEQDSALFEAVFTTCNLEVIDSLVTDDFEFYHDKWGEIAQSKAEFISLIRKQCERGQNGLDPRARRELDVKSVTVSRMEKYGAVQMGTHRFFRIEPGKPDQPTERAKFIHLWKNEKGKWKLARVISYEHEDVE